MKKPFTMLIVIFASIFLTGNICAAPSDNEVYKEAFVSAISKLNKALATRNLPILSYDARQLNVIFSHDYLRKIDIAQVSVPDCGIDIIPGSLDIIAFQRALSEQSSKSPNISSEPRWTKDEAEKQSRFWYENIIGKFPANVGAPLIRFESPSSALSTLGGRWDVCWPRIDAEGHRFAQDAINVTFSEKFGLLGVANLFISKFSGNQKIQVSKEQAIEIGRPIALKMLGSPIASQWSKGLVLRDNASAELWIVNPNHILEMKGMEDAASSGDLTARLAWIVTYRASNDQHMGSDVYVWIDAETKKILGGDFK